MKIILITVLCLILAGCHRTTYYTITKDERIADDIMYKVAKKLKVKTQLIACGTGGEMMHQIKMLALSFDYYNPIQIEDGRQLLVEATKVFIEEVNNDSRIHQYLYQYPFTPHNIEIRIFVHNPNGSDISVGTLHVISMLRGILAYYITDPQTDRLTIIYEETYEEALEKLEKNIFSQSQKT